MAKENYREKVEEHRQQIDLHNESDAKMSRVSRHRKKGAKKQRNPLMTLLVFVFIFIPLGILGYVLFIFDPGTNTATTEAKEEDKDQLVEILKQDPSEAKVIDTDENDDENAEKDEAKDQAEKEKLADEKAKKAEQEIAAEEKKIKEAEAAQKVAAQKAKEQEQKKNEDEAKNTQQQTHTVQSTDNLYRIAIKYYGDGSTANIEKIKKANNLTSDSISTGQVLIINP
jgi:colicin import membrane protein